MGWLIALALSLSVAGQPPDLQSYYKRAPMISSWYCGKTLVRLNLVHPNGMAFWSMWMTEEIDSDEVIAKLRALLKKEFGMEPMDSTIVFPGEACPKGTVL